ncbi:RHS repeat-associated core domain-containing protein [Chryseobacterium wanjuense]|uniref:RHS repeat-associated core domain-containing protein n=1 Tax=Chryseobacterium wanjuense TaxID=356305 RepID=A0A1I0QLP2_9FLAO|nr:SpvB/TcaC N-terminal domain-containing protein [Chryseobacterium wanjuense]SEW27959.1 RHS repeat-associated core domain-containing protein [Chryseobacterium wanjuense]
MKINLKRLPVTKKSCLLVCFFGCMFVFASFTKEDRLRVRAFKENLVSKLTDKKNVDSLHTDSVKESVKEPLAKNDTEKASRNILDKNNLSDSEKRNKLSFNGDHKVWSNVISYPSKEKEGTIGTFSDKEEDKISDNFFTIDVSGVNKDNKTAYLEYDLFGLASYQSVPRSINHNVAIGGNVIIPNARWSRQREAISADLIKNGINTILFTSPSEGVKYKIKNLKIVFDKDTKYSGLIVNPIVSKDQLYITGNSVATKDLTINGENISVKNGEFEKLIKLSENDKLKGGFSIIENGSTTYYKIPAEINSFKTLNANYFNAKGLEISQDKEVSIDYEGINIKVEKETSESAYLEVLKLRGKDFPATSQGLKNVTVGNSAYRLSVVSGKLDKKVKLTIPYDEKRLGLVSPKEIKTFYFDYNEKQWKIENTAVVDEKLKTVTIETKGDGDYINGIISVPESPQTNAFAPTSISGLKAGDPAAGIQLMSPPVANQNGSAAISYPVEIPAGRNGMQPSVAISYDSSKGNGWMGEGWDISGISSITLDTRWGTPTFTSNEESEIYVLDGEMLMYDGDYLPHRQIDDTANNTFNTTRQNRNSSGVKRFFLRKGNNFTKIERYGTSPSTYRWVITGTDGTKRYYGGDESAVNNTAVLTTEDGNIVQWQITKEIDVNNNNIKYYYDNVKHVNFVDENANLNQGKSIHINKITYTGLNDEDGLYSIVFRPEPVRGVPNTSLRPDMIIDAKQGVKRIEPARLLAINTYYNGSPIRNYTFDYKIGAFYKSLLQTISTNGVSYNLNYHNDTGSGGSMLFGNDTNVSAPNTDAFSGAVNSMLTPSKISATNNLEWGWSLRIGAGLGLLRPHSTGDKNFMINGFGGESYSNVKGSQELIDFNGDGVVDILYRKRNGDEGLKFFPGSVDSSGNLTFNAAQKDVLNLRSNFSRTIGTTWNAGATVLFNWWKMGFDFTKSWAQSESETPIYLIDANSDGLPDVVNDGKVWFNKLNSNGQPELVTTSEATENMVITGNTPIPYTEPEDPADENEEPVKAKNDVVKVWIAPKSGYVKIADNISISGTIDSNAKAVYSIEIRNPDALPKNGRLYLTTLAGGNSNIPVQIQHYNDYPSTPLGITNASRIYVNSGEKIFFRLHKKKGINYIVNTRPSVRYTDSNGAFIPDSAEEEQDGFQPNDLKYEDKFLLNNLIKSIKYTKAGSAKIKIPKFDVSRLNDDVTFSIILSKATVTDPSTDIIEVYKKTYNESAGVVSIAAVDTGFSIPTDDDWRLKFIVQSDSYMNKELEWKNIEVNSYYNKIVNDVAQYPSYYVKNFSKKFNLSALGNIPSGSNDYSISVNKSFAFAPVLTGAFTYVIKRNGHVLGKRQVSIATTGITESNMSGSPISGINPILFYTGNPAQGVSVDQRINILVYCNTYSDRVAYEALKNQLQGNIFNIYYGTSPQLLGATTETSLNAAEFNGISAVYHNWGQFIYNENKDVKIGNNPLNPPGGPKDIPTGPVATSGPDYTLNPTTPKDQYGMLINNDYLDTLFGSFNYDYSSCSGSANATEYGDCVGDILQANFQNMSNNILQAYSPIVPMNTYYKKDESGTFVEKWINNQFTEQYSMPTTFRDEENMMPFFVDDDPDQPNIEVAGNINTRMFAISKKQKSKSKTTNWGLGIPVISNSYTQLRGYGNINTQDFFDVNGDGYPDMLYRTQSQLSNALGGLKGAQGRNLENSGDSVISNNDSFQKTQTIAFSPSAIKDIARNTSNNNSDAKPDTSPSWSGGLSFSDYPDSYDKGLEYWIDINGDGLVDRVKEINGVYQYKLNYGTGLVNNPYEDFKDLATNSSAPVGSTSVSIGGGLSGMLDTTSTYSAGWGISGSVSASSSSGTSKQTFQDINGDGLVDILTVDSGLTVRYNLGNKFSSPVEIRKGANLFGNPVDFRNEVKTYNGALGLNGGFYVNIPILTIFGATILYFRAGADTSANIGLSVSEINKALRDVNGDGYPDLVMNTGGGMTVNYSKIKRTNKLASVTEKSTNGTFLIDYGFSKPSYQDPHSRLVMTQITVADPHIESYSYSMSNTSKNLVTRFSYENSKYDRRERTNYGFAKVTIERMNGSNVSSKVIQTFYNSNYYNNGLLRTNEVYRGSSLLSSKTENTYKLYKFINNYTQIEEIPSQFESYDSGGTEGRKMATTLLAATENTSIESSGSIVTNSTMDYNNKGQLAKYKYFSNLPEGNYSSSISYHTISSLLAKNILNIPSEIKVFDSNNELKRQRNTEVDTSTGDITKVIVKLNSGTNAETLMTYDTYGNIKTIHYPNDYSLTYDYDTTLNKYITKVTDSFDVESSSTYDPSWDALLTSTDVTGNQMTYTYDSMGRLTSILAPKEVGVSPYTVKYSYFLSPMIVNNITVNLYGAVTQNFDPQHPSNPIETITLSDFAGNAVQVKKDIEIDGIEKMSVSGMIITDLLARPVKQYHPTFENKDDVLNKKLKLTLAQYFTSTEYDELDRVISSIDEVGHATNVKYDIEGDYYKQTAAQMQNGSVELKSDQLTNAEGKTVFTRNYLGASSPLVTTYNYNSIGELLSTKDAEGIITKYQYDMGGRRTVEEHPDHGMSRYEYDKAGQMISRTTDNLGSAGLSDPFIHYNYNRNRLVRITYPPLPSGSPNPNDVFYEYGSTGNETAKLITKQDGTGTTGYAYGNMGELIQESRQVSGYNIPNMNFNTLYEYDSWNRLKKINYPDFEQVTYLYDLGGNLKKVSSNQYGDYIKDIQYDEYEQRTKIKYGNDTYSAYTYLPERRLLATHKLQKDSFATYLDASYGYDFVGNILNISATGGTTPNSMGGSYEYIYAYDAFNRLTSSTGTFLGNIKAGTNIGNMTSSYSTELSYRAANGIDVKRQNHVLDGSTNPVNTYENIYEYIDGTHKVGMVQDGFTGNEEKFEYDANGNPTLYLTTTDGPKNMFWDEEDNMKAYYAAEQGFFQYYAYDDKGERTIKYNLDADAALYQNGTIIDPGSMLMTSYKVYPNPYNVITSDGKYTKHYYEGSKRFASRLGDNPGIFFKQGVAPTKNTVDPQVDFKNYLEKAGVDAKGIETEFAKSSAQNGLYYLHGDHLGTTSFVTDDNAVPTQFFLNLPFGETFAEQQIQGKYENPYKFNAKELDSETSLYYYGARYFNPRLSIWYGVDPIAIWNPVMENEFYGDGDHNAGVYYHGNLNPYIYTYQNPVKYIDPNGKQVDWQKYWNQAKEFANDAGDVLGQVAHNIAPVRPATASDPKTLGEAWNNLKNAPANIKEIYTNGSLKDKTVVTLSLLALMKGKSPAVPGTALAGFNLSKYAKYGMCVEFASAFKKAYGGTVLEIKANYMSLIKDGKEIPITQTGMHRVVEKVVDGESYIFDNINPKGVLKSEYEQMLEGAHAPGRPISGAELLKNAKKIK